MNLNDLVKEFGLDVKVGSQHLDREVTGGYASPFKRRLCEMS